jgi:hypothetical protein
LRNICRFDNTDMKCWSASLRLLMQYIIVLFEFDWMKLKVWKEDVKVELQLDHDVLRRYFSFITYIHQLVIGQWTGNTNTGLVQVRTKLKTNTLISARKTLSTRSGLQTLHSSSIHIPYPIHTLHPLNIHSHPLIIHHLTICRYLLFATQLFEKVFIQKSYYFLHFEFHITGKTVVTHMLPTCCLVHFVANVYNWCVQVFTQQIQFTIYIAFYTEPPTLSYSLITCFTLLHYW